MALIDRDELLKTIEEGVGDIYVYQDGIVDLINEMPVIEQKKEKHGHWIEEDEDYNAYKCSVCGEVWCIIDGTPQENGCNYCQNCGAKMDEVTE